MKNFLGILTLILVSSCAVTPKQVVKYKKEQNIVFKSSEVPYFTTVKKNGKLSVIMVEPKRVAETVDVSE